jgi:hypothetical protein
MSSAVGVINPAKKNPLGGNSRLHTKNPNDSSFFSSGPQEQLLYLIDFGISTPFVNRDGKLLPQKVMRNIRCSPQYAGLSQLNGMSK